MLEPLMKAGVLAYKIDVIHSVDAQAFHKYLRYEGLGRIGPVVPLAHDVPNCGWSLLLDSGEELFYATDTGTLDGIEAKGYGYYFIEANHLTADIEARAAEKLAKGEFAYEMRAAATHLSYEQAMDWLYKNMGPRSEYILLHGHSEKEKDNADKI